jgi:hypothetical protein
LGRGGGHLAVAKHDRWLPTQWQRGKSSTCGNEAEDRPQKWKPVIAAGL